MRRLYMQRSNVTSLCEHWLNLNQSPEETLYAIAVYRHKSLLRSRRVKVVDASDGMQRRIAC